MIALGAVASASADTPPIGVALGFSGQVSGVPVPATATTPESGPWIGIQATDNAGSKLAMATATVDGVTIGTADLCSDPSDPTACASEYRRIPFDSTQFADGAHTLVVSVTDAAGNTPATVTQSFEILNHPNLGSPTATLPINSTSSPQVNGSANNPASNGGVEGASESSCTSPKLSMQLSDKPLRLSKGHPVLLKNKRYKFTGKLTCLIGNKRHSAPQSTRVALYSVIGKKTHFDGGTLVRAKGAISTIFTVSSSRTLQFRVTAANGKTTKVSIKVVVTKKKTKG